MKKTIVIAFVALFVSLGFISCYDNTDFLTEAEKNTQYLVNAKNGWRLVTATSTPIYDDAGGSTANNLLKSFLEEWDLDDIVYYKEDGKISVNPDSSLPAGGIGYTEYTELGEWSVAGNDGLTLNTHLPFLYTKGEDTKAITTITAINSTAFSINYTYMDVDETPEKKYEFSLTYRAK